MNKYSILAVQLHSGQEAGLGHLVNLVESEDSCSSDSSNQFEHIAIPCPKALARIDQKTDEIGFLERFHRVPNHLSVHTVLGLMDSGSIVEDQLPSRLTENPDYPVTGGLRLVSGDTQLLANESIQQRRFANIRAPGDRDSAAFSLQNSIAVVTRNVL